MKMSNKGIVELVGHEGICLSKYRDSVGVWTIGVGATRTEIPDLASWPLSKTITMEDAFSLLGRSLLKYEIAVSNSLTREIAQTQFDALVSWCYNVGVGYTKPVRNRKGEMTRNVASVIRLLNSGASGAELYRALMLYKKPPEIIERRRKEASLLAYGTYSNDGKALLFPVSSSGYPIYSRGKSINVWEHVMLTSEVEPEPTEVATEEEKKLESRPSFLQQVLNIIKALLK